MELFIFINLYQNRHINLIVANNQGLVSETMKSKKTYQTSLLHYFGKADAKNTTSHITLPLQKDDRIDQQTNTSVVQTKQTQSLKRAQSYYTAEAKNQAINQHYNQDSQTQPLFNRKISLVTDEEDTRIVNGIIKEHLHQQIKQQANLQTKIKKQPTQLESINHKDSPVLQAKNNKKVQQIFQKESLRSRFTALLKNYQKYQIGDQHIRLLKILRATDNTLCFVTRNKNTKSYRFCDLQKTMHEHSLVDISLANLQQILFIDSNLIDISWKFDQINKQYDVQVQIPQIKSEDQRISNTRAKIVQYLMSLQIEYLSKNKINKVKLQQWAPGFNPNHYQIPLKALPTHPLAKQASLVQLSDSQIRQVKNERLKNIMMEVKENEDNKSAGCDDVTSMILSKVSTQNVQEYLEATLYENQTQKQTLNLKSEQGMLDKQKILSMCESIMLIFMSNAVTNMFKSTLIQILCQKYSYKNDEIVVYLNYILSVKQMPFLIQNTTSKQIAVLRINKTQFNDITKFFKHKT